MITDTPTAVTRLASAYWRVAYGPETFVQWPVGWSPTSDHVFHGGPDAGAVLTRLLRWIPTQAGQAAFHRATQECGTTSAEEAT